VGSRLRDILEMIRDELRDRVDGGASYDFDLRTVSSTPRVDIGESLMPPSGAEAHVLITPIGRPSNETPGQVQLNSYGRTLTVQITGLVKATTAPGGEALLRACDLADDIELALETSLADATKLGSLLHGLSFDYDVLSGAALQLPAGFGAVLGTVTCHYQEVRAA